MRRLCPPTALEELLAHLADLVAEQVIDKLRAADLDDYVDQASSPLGRRRHINAIRFGELRGAQIGRRYLATKADVEAFISKTTTKRSAQKPEATSRTDLEQELGLVPNDKPHPED